MSTSSLKCRCQPQTSTRKTTTFLSLHETAVNRANQFLRHCFTLYECIAYRKFIAHSLSHQDGKWLQSFSYVLFVRTFTKFTHHTSTGSKQRESTVDAVPLPSGTGSRPRDSRHRTYTSTKRHYTDRLHTDRRKMARSSAQRDIAQSHQNSRSQSQRLPNSRS